MFVFSCKILIEKDLGRCLTTGPQINEHFQEIQKSHMVYANVCRIHVWDIMSIVNQGIKGVSGVAPWAILGDLEWQAFLKAAPGWNCNGLLPHLPP